MAIIWDPALSLVVHRRSGSGCLSHTDKDWGLVINRKIDSSSDTQRVKHVTIINIATDATTAITTMTSAAAATITTIFTIISICIPLTRRSMCILTRLYCTQKISLQRKEILRFPLTISIVSMIFI